MVDYVIQVLPTPTCGPFDAMLAADRCEQVTIDVPAGADGRCQLWRNHDMSLQHAIRYHRDRKLMIRSWQEDPARTTDTEAPVRGDGEAAYWAVATYPAWNEDRPIEVKQATIGPTRRRAF